MNFKIQLLTLNGINEEDNTAYYITNVLADFVDQSEEYKSLFPKHYISSDWSRITTDDDFYTYPERNSSFSYTYEESISFHQNGQAEFSFKMDNFIIQQNEWIQNPFVDAVTVGSVIAVTSLEETRIFTVKKIGTSFSTNNCTYSYTCQDSFSYQLSRQNKGYTIDNDSTSDDFIGAKTIDYWADKICTECHIPYYYIPLKKPLFLVDNMNTTEVSSTNTNVIQVLKSKYSEAEESEYFETIIFSVSSSSANEALISLGEKFGMQLKVYEYLGKNSSTNQFFVKRYIWFFPIKDGDHLSGWSYNPSSNIQSFSLTQNAENLSTVLNVNSNESNDDLISLFPTLPPFFSKVYGSAYWLNSIYYKGYFTQLCQYYTEFFTNDDNFINTDKIEGDIPSLDGRLQDYTLFLLRRNTISTSRINRLKLYNKITFNNNEIYSYCNSGDVYYYSNVGGWLIAYQKDSTAEWIYYNDEDEIDEDTWNKLITYLTTEDEVSYKFAIAVLGDFLSIGSYSINLFFTRNWSQEELDYAAIADLCPWLENKLIDFKYMYDANIISKKQYLEIDDYFNNKLRIINGQLALYSNEYYTAYHKKTTTLAELISQLDSLAAMAEADIIQPYQDTGKTITSLENFKLAYSLLWQDKKQSAERTSIIDYDKTITYYSKLYFNAQQRFLKNIYNFRKYFEENNSRFTNGTLLTTVTIESNSDNDNSYWLGLKNPGLYTLFTENNYEENPPLYQLVDGIYNRVYPVTEDNYSNYLIFNEKSSGSISLGNTDTYQKDQEYWAYLKLKSTGNKITTYKDSSGIPTLDNEDVEGYTTTKTVMKPIASYDLDDPQMGDIWVMRNKDKVYQRNENTYTQITKFWPDTTGGHNVDEKSWENPLTEITYEKDTNTSGNDYYNFNFNYNTTDSKNPKPRLFIDAENNRFDLVALMVQYSQGDGNKDLTLRELYAKYFPVKSYYYQETDTNNKTNYREISLVTYQNESNYYKHVAAGDTTGTVLNIVGGAVAATGAAGLIIGVGLWIASAVVRSNGYNTETWGTTGDSQAPIDFYYKDWSKQISYWSNNFYFPWYLKDDDDETNLINLVQDSETLTYSNFFNLLGLTYSCLALKPIDSMPSGKMIAAPITGSVANNQKKFYYKESYARFKKGSDYCNYNDTYYIFPLVTYFSKNSFNDYNEYNSCFNNSKTPNIEDPTKCHIGPLAESFAAEISTPLGNIQILINEQNRISTILNYPLFDKSASVVFSKEQFNTNGKTTLNEVLKTYYPEGIRSDGNLFYGTCKLEDNSGKTLYPNISCDKVHGHAVYSVNYKHKTNDIYYSHTVFLVLHKEDYDKTTIENNYSPLQGRPFYYEDDDSKVDFSAASGIVEGLYTQVNVADKSTLKTPTEWDENQTYFDSNYYRAYTLQQYLENATALKIYTLYNNKYKFSVVLSPNQPVKFSLPTTYNKISDFSTGKVQTISESTLDIYLIYDYDNKSNRIRFCDKDGLSKNTKWQVSENYEENTYKGTLTLEEGDYNVKDLGKLSNGEFWYLYHNNEDESTKTLLEYSAIIETQLQTYWTAAYGASKGCDYFLPQYWQPTIVADINYFSKDVIINKGTETEPDLQISSYYVPHVAIVKSGKDDLLPDYNWTFMTSNQAQVLTETQKLIVDYGNLSNNTAKAMNENEAISDFLSSISYLGDPLEHWVLQPLNGITKTYYTSQSGGCTWPQLISELTGGTYSAQDFNGTYPMLLKKWGQRYDIDEMVNYNNLLVAHNKLWEEIYQNYPNIVLEENYSDSDAVSSNDLLKGARNYLRQYYQPESDYDITVINRSDLKGSGYIPSIGQGILVDPTYYSNLTSTNFSNAVQQYLFVTDISYTLRSSSDIKLTVNAIKYSDKLIQRLAKLIK